MFRYTLTSIYNSIENNIYCIINYTYCSILIMCFYNVQASFHVTFTFTLLHWNLFNIWKKNLLFRSHPRGLVYSPALLHSLSVCRTTCRPALPTPPPPCLHVRGSGTPREQGEGAGSLLVISWPLRSGRITLHLGEHPCQSTRARDCFSQQQRS